MSFDRAQAAYDAAVPRDRPAGPGDRYDQYLAEFDETNRADYVKFLVDVEAGNTDPLTYEEFCADGEQPQTFDEWLDDLHQSEYDDAMERRAEEARERSWV